MVEMNVEKARHNMIEQQIRPWDVLDEQVLELIADTPREAFVPEEHRALAFTDIEIPLGKGRHMLAPRVEARIRQAINVQPGDKVLEVGTGSGYLTALLARRAAHVYSVDIDPAMLSMAEENLNSQGIDNVTLEEGDAARGWDAHVPYDVIVLGGSVAQLDPSLKHALNGGGRMFAVVGEGPAMNAVLITRTGGAEWAEEELFEIELEPLENSAAPHSFEL